MAAPQYIKFIKSITYGEQQLSFRKNSAKLTIGTEVIDINANHDSGSMLVERVISGYNGELVIEVLDDSIDVLKYTLPVKEVGQELSKSQVNQNIGTVLESQELVITTSAGEADTWGFYKATIDPNYSTSYGEAGYRTIKFVLAANEGQDLFWRGKKPSQE